MSSLFESTFEFEQEMLFCFAQLVGMGNYYDYDCPFTYWNTDVKSSQFASALICCVLQMLFHIAKEDSEQDHAQCNVALC